MTSSAADGAEMANDAGCDADNPDSRNDAAAEARNDAAAEAQNGAATENDASDGQADDDHERAVDAGSLGAGGEDHRGTLGCEDAGNEAPSDAGTHDSDGPDDATTPSDCSVTSAELCDGQDNDCDGVADEGASGGNEACSTGLPGPCGAGTTMCASGALVCRPTSGALEEMCNGFDDDCDGQPDEGNPGGGSPCNTGLPGLCSAGVMACEFGQVVCGEAAEPAEELCDSADNDCDTAVDEDCETPHVNFVAPYVGISDRPGTIIARGLNFDALGATLNILLGDLEIGPLTADGDTQVTINYPALPAGRYPVALRTPTGRSSTNAELVIVSAPALNTDFITAPSRRLRILYDAERQMLYAVNELDQEIERYRYDSGAWTILSAYVLPQLTDLGLAPDGRSLIALTRSEVHEIRLDGPAFAAQARATNPDPFCSQYLDSLAMSNDGHAFIVTKFSACSGSSVTYLYDVLDYSLRSNPYFQGYLYNGIVGGSLDGSRIYAGSNGLSPAPEVSIFNSLTSTITPSSVHYNLSAVSVSGNASRVILQNTTVYSRALSPLGSLPSGGAAFASRDSTRAFVYRDDPPGPRLIVHDLEGTLQSGGTYPVLTTIDLHAAPSTTAGSYYDVAMTSTPDDAAVFVSGDLGIAVVPIP